MTRNRLGESASPYLRQHADNPVHWWSWTPEAFEEARQRNVPVHLSIGYAACHWCHVMAHESFSDPETAALLNARFVNIKVDREERPDIDQIYMRALQGLGEHGGWPLTMFLTPGGEPFWGGTYFPPEPRFGRPSFRQLLDSVARAWQAGDAAIGQNSRALKDFLNRRPASGEGPLAPDLPVQAASRALSIWDPVRGGFSGAPKFPHAAVLDLLWRAQLRAGDPRFEEAVLTTLIALSQGGIYDHLGGGYARYAVDADWLVPHFEKMLSDNAQLLTLLVQAFGRTGNPILRQRIAETAGWMLREMRLPEGGFAASLDADTEGHEGLTYVWTPDEIGEVLGPEDAASFNPVYGVSPEGNFEGKNVLNRLAPHARAWLGDDEEARLAAMRARLLEARSRRPQPARDDKVLADWNGAAIAGLAAAASLGDEAWLRAAEGAFRFVSESMSEGDRLAHSSAFGQLLFPGFASDYAQMIRAAIALYAATADSRYLDQAARWYRALEADYFDPAQARYHLTAHSAESLVARPSASADDAMPSANGVMVQNCVQLFNLTSEPGYRSRAEEILQSHAGALSADIVGSASLLSGFDSVLRGRLVVLTGSEDLAPLRALIRAEADPALLMVEAKEGKAEPPRPEMQAMAGDAAALLLCDAAACRAPVSDASGAEALLKETRAGLAA